LLIWFSLSVHGSVDRRAGHRHGPVPPGGSEGLVAGLAGANPDGLLHGVEELTDLARRADGAIAAGDRTFAPDTPVSMNFWGFTPQIFPLLEEVLRKFLAQHAVSEKTECYIPSAVAEMIAQGTATVRVLPTDAGLVKGTVTHVDEAGSPIPA